MFLKIVNHNSVGYANLFATNDHQLVVIMTNLLKFFFYTCSLSSFFNFSVKTIYSSGMSLFYNIFIIADTEISNFIAKHVINDFIILVFESNNSFLLGVVSSIAERTKIFIQFLPTIISLNLK